MAKQRFLILTIFSLLLVAAATTQEVQQETADATNTAQEQQNGAAGNGDTPPPEEAALQTPQSPETDQDQNSGTDTDQNSGKDTDQDSGTETDQKKDEATKETEGQDGNKDNSDTQTPTTAPEEPEGDSEGEEENATTEKSQEQEEQKKDEAAEGDKEDTEEGTKEEEKQPSDEEAEAPQAKPPGYCKDGQPENVEEFLKKINEVRTKVRKGQQPNGQGGKRLPVATNIPHLKYSCDLENEAHEMLKTGKCDKELAKLPDKGYIYKSGDLEPAVTILEDVEGELLTGTEHALTSTEGAKVIYSGEAELKAYVNLISEKTTEIGCARFECTDDGKYSLLCLTDQNALKKGDTIYSVPNACSGNDKMSNAVRREFLDRHNFFRSLLAQGFVMNGKSGKPCRKAVKLQQLVYDCKLEASALKVAQKCDKTPSRVPTTGLNPKENSITLPKRAQRTHQKAAQQAMQLWWKELENGNTKLDQRNTYRTVALIRSFAKMASDHTTKVGCAIHDCNNGVNIVCHYATALTNGKQIYVPGPKLCNKCPKGPKDCHRGLCSAAVTGDKI